MKMELKKKEKKLNEERKQNCIMSLRFTEIRRNSLILISLYLQNGEHFDMENVTLRDLFNAIFGIFKRF